MASRPTRQLLSLNWAIRGLFLIPDSFLFCNSWWWRVRFRWGATDTISDLYWTSLRMNFGWPFFPIFFLLYIYKKMELQPPKCLRDQYSLFTCLSVWGYFAIQVLCYEGCISAVDCIFLFYKKKVWLLVSSTGFLSMPFLRLTVTPLSPYTPYPSKVKKKNAINACQLWFPCDDYCDSIPTMRCTVGQKLLQVWVKWCIGLSLVLKICGICVLLNCHFAHSAYRQCWVVNWGQAAA